MCIECKFAIYVCMYVCMYVYMYVCMYVYMYVCMYMQVHMSPLSVAWVPYYVREAELDHSHC